MLHSSQLPSANCNDNGIITIYIFLQNILLKDVPCDIVNLSTICGSVYHKLKITRKKKKGITEIVLCPKLIEAFWTSGMQ